MDEYMANLLRRIDDSGERYLMLVFYCFVVFVVVNEVVRRFVLDFSSLWGEEAARYGFIYLGWIGASDAVKQRAHIRFDIVMRLLPPRWHGYVYLFGEAATLVFAVFALYWSLNSISTMIKFDALSPAMRISQAWFVAAVPLGFAMLSIRVLQSAWRDIGDLRAGRKAYGGSKLFE